MTARGAGQGCGEVEIGRGSMAAGGKSRRTYMELHKCTPAARAALAAAASVMLGADSERKVNVWRVEWAMSAEGRWWPQAKVFLSEQEAEHFTQEAKLYPRRYACLRVIATEQEMPA